MTDMEKVIKGLEICKPSKHSRTCGICPYREEMNCDYEVYNDAFALLKEQEELLKHEYWHGYNNGRADERGLQEGTIMQTFSPD